MDNKASVIIPTFNKLERLRLALESFKYQSAGKENFEVIVVSDGATDGTNEFLQSQQYDFKFKWIEQDNKGRSAARNAGARIADYPVLIFCDDDTIASKDFIRSHVGNHTRNSKLVIHGMIYNLPYLKFFRDPSSGTVFNGLDSKPTYLEKMLIGVDDVSNLVRITAQKKLTRFEKNIKCIFDKNVSELHWLGFTGGNVSVAKDVFMESGMFAEDFGARWGCEDLELGYRLARQGVSFAYSETACNYHMAHFRCDYQEDIHASVQLFYSKHPEPIILHLPLFLTEPISLDEFVQKYLKNEERKDE